ncbi:hypothetical protein PI125_g20566 [Phytophthora idaei]|nr:hypothetical protein PI125_g20566 [Phytophthora idaei]
MPAVVVVTGANPPVVSFAAGCEETPDQPISCHSRLTTYVQAALCPEVVLVDVHPHPRICGLVSLWAGGRRWALERKRYKYALEERGWRRGKGQVAPRASKWVELSETTWLATYQEDYRAQSVVRATPVSPKTAGVLSLRS